MKKAMSVSSRRYQMKCAVLLVFLFGAFLVSVVAGEDASGDYFSDHFDGAIDLLNGWCKKIRTCRVIQLMVE